MAYYRNLDMALEAAMSDFMDDYFYARLQTSNEVRSACRITDVDQQIKGTDVLVVWGQEAVPCHIDEKSQLHYLNNPLPTFAFEISFLRFNTPIIGWLCNQRLDTDQYLLIWPYGKRSWDEIKEQYRAARNQDRFIASINKDEFTRVECILLEKQTLLNYLGSLGLTIGRMQRDAAVLRDQQKYRKNIIPGIHGIYYYFTEWLMEQPINLVVSKRVLDDLARAKYIVTPTSITVI